MGKNLVSIVMPAFNASVTIAGSIDSVLGQTYQEWELIIVNDGSCDSTADIVKVYCEKDPRIVVLTNKKNQGVSKARSRGIKGAKSDWIAFLDSDDMWNNSKRFFIETGTVRIRAKAASYGSPRRKISCSISSLWCSNSSMGFRHCQSLTACSGEIAPSMRLEFPQPEFYAVCL